MRNHTFGAKSGFSIIEVMISLAILATAISAMMGLIYPMDNLSKQQGEKERAAEIAQLLIERFQGAIWSEIGTRPWSWHRYELADVMVAADVTRNFVDQLTTTPVIGDPDFSHRPMTDEPNDTTRINLYDFLAEPTRNGGTSSTPISLSEFPRDEFGLIIIDSAQKNAYGSTITYSGLISGDVDNTAVKNKYLGADRYNWLQFLGILNEPSGLQDLEVYVEFYDMDAVLAAESYSDWEANRLTYLLDQSHINLDLNSMADMDQKSVLIRILVQYTDWQGVPQEHEVTLGRRR